MQKWPFEKRYTMSSTWTIMQVIIIATRAWFKKTRAASAGGSCDTPVELVNPPRTAVPRHPHPWRWHRRARRRPPAAVRRQLGVQQLPLDLVGQALPCDQVWRVWQGLAESLRAGVLRWSMTGHGAALEPLGLGTDA